MGNITPWAGGRKTLYDEEKIFLDFAEASYGVIEKRN